VEGHWVLLMPGWQAYEQYAPSVQLMPETAVESSSY
jgi:hypothetical protein